MLLAILQSQHGAEYFYYFYHICYLIRVICHIRRCLKLDCFTSTKWSPYFARLTNNCNIIYTNNSGMTVKTVYISTISLPNILWHYCVAVFRLNPLKSTAAYSGINVNNEVKLTIQKLARHHESHDFSKSNIFFHTRPVYYNTHMSHSPFTFLLSTINSNLWYSE